VIWHPDDCKKIGSLYANHPSSWRRIPCPNCRIWRLADATLMTTEQLKRMFMGKLPNPAQRKLLGIEKVKKAS
jgi:hypothetical protein